MHFTCYLCSLLCTVQYCIVLHRRLRGTGCCTGCCTVRNTPLFRKDERIKDRSSLHVTVQTTVHINSRLLYTNFVATLTHESTGGAKGRKKRKNPSVFPCFIACFPHHHTSSSAIGASITVFNHHRRPSSSNPLSSSSREKQQPQQTPKPSSPHNFLSSSTRFQFGR